jgi:hypothetical protein
METVVQKARYSDRESPSGKRRTKAAGKGASLYEPKNYQEKHQNNAYAAPPRRRHGVRTTPIRDIQDFAPENVTPHERS